MSIKSLSDVLLSYKYGQFNLLDNNFSASLDYAKKEGVIQNFYAHNFQSVTGSCSELMNYAFKKIKSIRPSYTILRAVGNDPKFFSTTNSKHCFLLIFEKDSFKRLRGKEPCNIPSILSVDPLVFDPSFKVLSPYFKSNYSVSRVFNENCMVTYSHNLLLRNFEYAPLFIANSTIISVGLDFRHPSVLSIGFKKPSQNIVSFDLHDDSMFRYFSSSTLKEFVNVLRGCKKEKSKNLKLDNFLLV